jgi:hypothetical protein
MQKKDELKEITNRKDDLGYVFWEMESYENFFPFYKSMMKKSEK